MSLLLFVMGVTPLAMTSTSTNLAVAQASAGASQQNDDDDEETVTHDNGKTVTHEKVIRIPPGQSSLKVDNILNGRMTAFINGGRNIIDQEATTTSHLSWNGGNSFPWDDAYFLNGFGTNGYWYQCGLMHREDPARWVMNVEVFDPNSNSIWNSISSTTIPSETSVKIKQNVPAHNGGNGVQCEMYWGSNGLIFSYTIHVPSAFLLTSTPTNNAVKTSWMTEYTTGGNGVTVGSVTYSSPKFVDTGHVTQAITQVN